jgi:hypothetical protein
MKLLLLLIALYAGFYLILDAIFHNAMSAIVAGIAAALVGLVISSLGGKS